MLVKGQLIENDSYLGGEDYIVVMVMSMKLAIT